MDPMEAIKQTYYQECDELLLAMEEGLIAMENGEADSETINAVFRAVHSIKGGGGAFGFDILVEFAHIFETVLDLIRSNQLTPTNEVVKVLLRAGDKLSDHVTVARDGTGEVQDSEVKEELARLAGEDGEGGGSDPAPADFEGLTFTPMMIDLGDEAPAAPVIEDAGPAWHVRFAPHAGLYAKANEPYLLIRELAALGPVEVTPDLSNLPELVALEPEQAYFAWDIVLRDCADKASVEEVFEFVSGDCDLEISEWVPPAAPVAAEVIADGAPEVVVEEIATTSEPQAVEPTVANDRKPAAANLAGPAAAAETVKQTIRVDLDKVDRLVNLVGELVITQAMLSQRILETTGAQTTIGAGLGELEHLLRELQEAVMAIRTQPVKSVFQRMPRLVRETAAQTGKEARLEIEGEATEVDKTVIERLGEPLTHMIRNAIDHGLETPEERVAAGKPAEGTVKLSAEHRGGRIVIEVADDGRGINRAKVRQKAIERGLIAPNANLSDEEVDNLIFLPGFSTAAQVSNISGRGVGLDVVRRNIIDLGGRINISSVYGKGSKFSLTLPLTLAVLDGMIVAVGNQTFVLPLSHIIESLLPKRSDVKQFGSNGMLLNVRGVYVPLVSVGRLLGVQGASYDVTNSVVILVESEGIGRMALAVDAIVGQRQVVIKSFEANIGHIQGIAAATILGDGRVALILDIDGLVAGCRESAARSIEYQQAAGA
ncbi:two-component system chemotaxis sensor kinase CheA [Rhizomicrobium palustre]|uniref:Chemotaxis protein CheA n=1 Tax=Rhizomicrobium palustre TaxID=189966 RepID=A0A846N0M0_9PROT|nr:chemotaxis protein CheA [Rhizomicrobium palustre]NIK89236.1 two-component system chemotaxis sensor kinase CheA [Rhizomicrobium palustre]